MAKAKKQTVKVKVTDLKNLPNGEFFRLVDKNGNVSKKTYIKDGYDRSVKKYEVTNAEDTNDFRYIKGDKKVTTEFIY